MKDNKPSISNDDVFDRIDEELATLGNDIRILFSNCTSYNRVHDSLHSMIIERDDKIKSLQDRIDLFSSNECAMNDKILELEEFREFVGKELELRNHEYIEHKYKIKALEEEMKDIRNCIHQNETRLNKLESKEKIQLEHESLEEKFSNMEDHLIRQEEFLQNVITDIGQRLNDLENIEDEEKIKINFDWECLLGTTYRAKVIGGWIVRNEEFERSESMVFVPDPNHQWEI